MPKNSRFASAERSKDVPGAYLDFEIDTGLYAPPFMGGAVVFGLLPTTWLAKMRGARPPHFRAKNFK